MSTEDVGMAAGQYEPNYRISKGFAWQVEAGAKPNPFKLLTLARIIGFTLADAFKAIGATDAEICGHTLTLQQQAVVDQLNTENGEYFLKLQWALAEGAPDQAALIRGNLDMSFKLVCDEHGEPEWFKKREAQSYASRKIASKAG